MYQLSQLLFLCLLYLLSLTFFIIHAREVPYGLAIRIPGFHPGGRGSTPGMRTLFFNIAGAFFSSFYMKHWGWLC